MQTACVCLALGFVDLLGDGSDTIPDVGLKMAQSLHDHEIFKIVGIEPPRGATEKDMEFLNTLIGLPFDAATSTIHCGVMHRSFWFETRGILILRRARTNARDPA
jgi:hypothetical protein